MLIKSKESLCRKRNKNIRLYQQALFSFKLLHVCLCRKRNKNIRLYQQALFSFKLLHLLKNIAADSQLNLKY